MSLEQPGHYPKNENLQHKTESIEATSIKLTVYQIALQSTQVRIPERCQLCLHSFAEGITEVSLVSNAKIDGELTSDGFKGHEYTNWDSANYYPTQYLCPQCEVEVVVSPITG